MLLTVMLYFFVHCLKINHKKNEQKINRLSINTNYDFYYRVMFKALILVQDHNNICYDCDPLTLKYVQILLLRW